MKDEIRQVFDAVHADEALKARTRQRVLEAARPCRRVPRRVPSWPRLPVVWRWRRWAATGCILPPPR